jgi:hypothetical protein
VNQSTKKYIKYERFNIFMYINAKSLDTKYVNFSFFRVWKGGGFLSFFPYFSCPIGVSKLVGSALILGFGREASVVVLIHTCKRELSPAHLVCPWRHNA